MALSLNLLHEEIALARERRRNPLKIAMHVGAIVIVLLLAYYAMNAYQALAIRSRLSVVEHDWAKVEPQVTAAQKRGSELNNIVNTTKVLDNMIDTRFFWAPMLSTISRCVAPNVQLTSLDGVADESKGVNVTLDGIAAGREPRAQAEELRQLLFEQVGKSHKEVKVEFKTLEDLDTIANVGGAAMPTAHFVLTIDFNPYGSGKTPAAVPGRTKKSNHETKESE